LRRDGTRAMKANHFEGYCITRGPVHATRETGRSSAESGYVRREKERKRVRKREKGRKRKREGERG